MSVILDSKNKDERLDPYICSKCDSQMKKRIDWVSKTEHWICSNPDCANHVKVDITKK